MAYIYGVRQWNTKRYTHLVLTGNFCFSHFSTGNFSTKNWIANKVLQCLKFRAFTVPQRGFISPESRNSFSSVYSDESLFKFRLSSNFSHGVIVQIWLKNLSQGLFDSSKDFLSCFTSNKQEMGYTMLTGLPVEASESLFRYARLWVCRLAMVLFGYRAFFLETYLEDRNACCLAEIAKLQLTSAEVFWLT